MSLRSCGLLTYGFNSRALSNILKTVSDNRDLILKAWDDYFGN